MTFSHTHTLFFGLLCLPFWASAQNTPPAASKVATDSLPSPAPTALLFTPSDLPYLSATAFDLPKGTMEYSAGLGASSQETVLSTSFCFNWDYAVTQHFRLGLSNTIFLVTDGEDMTSLSFLGGRAHYSDQVAKNIHLGVRSELMLGRIAEGDESFGLFLWRNSLIATVGTPELYANVNISPSILGSFGEGFVVLQTYQLGIGASLSKDMDIALAFSNAATGPDEDDPSQQMLGANLIFKFQGGRFGVGLARFSSNDSDLKAALVPSMSGQFRF